MADPLLETILDELARVEALQSLSASTPQLAVRIAITRREMVAMAFLHILIRPL
jgi:hypothetical protein